MFHINLVVSRQLITLDLSKKNTLSTPKPKITVT